MDIEINIKVTVKDDGEFKLHGCPRFLCPNHMGNDYDLKTCFLENLIMSLQYAFEDDDKLAKGAQELKRKVLESIKIVRR